MDRAMKNFDESLQWASTFCSPTPLAQQRPLKVSTPKSSPAGQRTSPTVTSSACPPSTSTMTINTLTANPAAARHLQPVSSTQPANFATMQRSPSNISFIPFQTPPQPIMVEHALNGRMIFELFGMFQVNAQNISVDMHIRKINELRSIKNCIPEQDTLSNNIFNTMKESFEHAVRQRVQDMSSIPHKPYVSRYMESLNQKNIGLVNRVRNSFIVAKLNILSFIQSEGSHTDLNNQKLYKEYMKYRTEILNTYEIFSEDLNILIREMEHFQALNKANTDSFMQYSSVIKIQVIQILNEMAAAAARRAV
jgi:hypothetical protein